MLQGICLSSINQKVKEIENNLEMIEEKFDSEIHNLKLFKRAPLLFKSNNIIFNCLTFMCYNLIGSKVFM